MNHEAGLAAHQGHPVLAAMCASTRLLLLDQPTRLLVWGVHWSAHLMVCCGCGCVCVCVPGDLLQLARPGMIL